VVRFQEAGVEKRKPSSLDYETLLHELALNNWRRSLLRRDFARALQNAEELVRSRDRFWRWQGSLDLAVTHLCQGRSKSAREALEATKECFREAPGLSTPALEIEAHFFLETGRPHRTLEVLRGASIETPLLSYLRGLAQARLGDLEAAASVARDLGASGGPLELAFSRHVAAETRPGGALQALIQQTASLPRDLDSSSGGILVRFALASALFERGELESALGVFDEVLRDEESVLSWPIPFIRALFFRGRIRALRGDESGAIADGDRFLSFWGTGDLDRERVDEARQWVKA
jgi:tetratricopeptide (TPR) repeat protein